MTEFRQEEPRDIPAIASLLRLAFGGETEVRLVEVIRASDGFIPRLSLEAVEDGRVVGHVLLSPFPVPDEAFMALELVRGALDGVTGMISYPSVLYPPGFLEGLEE